MSYTQAPQPYTDLYRRRHAPPKDLPGGAPRTFFRWDGNITRAEFDAVPREIPRGPDCVHCGPAIRYQVRGPCMSTSATSRRSRLGLADFWGARPFGLLCADL